MTRRSFLLSSSAIACQPPNLAWITLSSTGRLNNQNWPAANRAVSVGSLLKPFLAIAYLSTHSQAPMIDCRGAADGCWQAPGHGRQDLVAALANSCNVYFLQIAQMLNRAALDLTCLSVGLAPPPRSWPAERLIGLGPGWPQPPLVIAEAFANLAHNRADPHVKIVLDGMARCAHCGTARAVGIDCYAKTGTAECSHLCGGLGDGYLAALYPLGQPRQVLLLTRHNATGATVARDLKRVLASIA